MSRKVTLSLGQRRSLSAARNVLTKLGLEVPSQLATLTTPTQPETYSPSREEIKRFVAALNTNKQVVVTIAGPSKRFTVYSTEGFLNRRRHIEKVNKARLNKHS